MTVIMLRATDAKFIQFWYSIYFSPQPRLNLSLNQSFYVENLAYFTLDLIDVINPLNKYQSFVSTTYTTQITNNRLMRDFESMIDRI